ncbi:MAG: hypothetical protein JWN04_5636, partial [Myxococcaceae bacterium]|nr:hypothetical protein [Myxococcaceae bacterium]
MQISGASGSEPAVQELTRFGK